MFRKSDSTIQATSIRFASAVVGNAGAPLHSDDSTWVSSALDDSVNDRENAPKEVDEPFFVDLGDDFRRSELGTRALTVQDIPE